MKQVRIDVQAGGQWALPFGKKKLRNLRTYAQVMGLTFSFKRFYIAGVTITCIYNKIGLDHIKIEVGGLFCLAEYITTGFLAAAAIYSKKAFETSRRFTITHPHSVPWLKADGSQGIMLNVNDGLGNASIQKVGGRSKIGLPVVIPGAMANTPTADLGVTQLYHLNPSIGSPNFSIDIYDLPTKLKTTHTVVLGANYSRFLHGVGQNAVKRLATVMFADTGSGVEVRASKLMNGVWTDYTVGTFANTVADANIQGPVGNTNFNPAGVAFDSSDNIYYVLAIPVNVGDTTYSGLTMRLYKNDVLLRTLGVLNLWSNPGIANFLGSPWATARYQALVHASSDGAAVLVSAWPLGGALLYHDAAVWLVVAGVATLVTTTTGGSTNIDKPQAVGITKDGTKFCIVQALFAYFYIQAGGVFALVATVPLTRNIWNDGDQYWYNVKTGNFVYMDHANNRLYRVDPTAETLVGNFTTPATATIAGTAYTLNEAAQRGTVWVARDLV